MKVIFFDLRDSEKEFFKSNSYSDLNITFFEEPLTRSTKLTDEQLDETDILVIYRSSILTKDILKKFKNLRIIATRSSGFNHIDLDFCTKNKIAVLNVDQYGEQGIAEYAFGLILALERNMKTAVLDVKNKAINHKSYEGKILQNLSIGIIGCGKVGHKLAEISHSFGMKALVSSYKDAPNFDEFCNVVSFNELLTTSDIIALHMPYTNETYQIIGQNEFNKMKNGVIIINTSSLDLIDINALYNNLKSGKISAAGLDVLDFDYTIGKKSRNMGTETMNTDENKKLASKIIGMPNVIVTPHLAYNTTDTINHILEQTFNNIRDCIKGMNTNRIC